MPCRLNNAGLVWSAAVLGSPYPRYAWHSWLVPDFLLPTPHFWPRTCLGDKQDTGVLGLRYDKGNRGVTCFLSDSRLLSYLCSVQYAQWHVFTTVMIALLIGAYWDLSSACVAYRFGTLGKLFVDTVAVPCASRSLGCAQRP